MPLIQCLVFLERERVSTVAGNFIPRSGSLEKESAPKKYVMTPSKVKNHPIFKLLQQAGFQVLANDPPSFPSNLKFSFCEMLVDEDPVSERLCLYVDGRLSELFKRLLGKRFLITSLLNCDVSKNRLDAIDKPNLALIEKFLVSGTDIWWYRYNYYNPVGNILHFAVKTGQTALINLLLEQGADPDATMDDCSTALHIAVQENKLQIASVLLENSADVNAVKKGGVTPMHIAVEEGFLNMVKLLVENGADLRVKNANGSTPLHLAVEKGHVEIAKQLILAAAANTESRVITNDRANDCTTALYQAVSANKLQIARLLLTNNANPNAVACKGTTPLHIAVAKGFVKMVKLLVENGADLRVKNADGSTPLHLAVVKEDVEIVEQLLLGAETDQERRAIINARTNDCSTPLHIAVSHRNLRTVGLLLKNNAKVDAVKCSEGSPLYIAAWKGFFDMVKLLVENGADWRVGKRGSSPLHVAVVQGHLNVVEYLLHQGFNPELRVIWNPEFSGETPLLRAVWGGSAEMVTILLQKGADVNAELYDGRTALNVALTVKKQGINSRAISQILAGYSLDTNNSSNREAFYHALAHPEVDRQVSVWLLGCGFDVTADDVKNPRLLFGAVRRNLPQIVEKFFTFGGSVQTFEPDGVSLLHAAARYADEDVVQLLLSHGAHVNAVTDDSLKRTPLSEAIKHSNVSAVKALLAANANVKDSPALLHSAFSRCPEVVQLLLECGADVNSPSSEGRTLLAVAAFTDKRNVVDILMKFGAQCCFRDTAPGNVSCSANFQAFLDYGFTDFDSESEIHFQKFLNHPETFTEYRGCAEMLARQIVKMQVAFEFDGTPIPTALGQKLKLDDFRENCESEIANLKLVMLPDLEVSLHSILTNKTQQISRYARRNERIFQFLEALNVKDSYPIYGSVLGCQRFAKGC